MVSRALAAPLRLLFLLSPRPSSPLMRSVRLWLITRPSLFSMIATLGCRSASSLPPAHASCYAEHHHHTASTCTARPRVRCRSADKLSSRSAQDSLWHTPLPSSSSWASEVFCQQLLHGPVVQRLLGHNLLQSPVLILKRPQPLQLVQRQPSVLGSALVEGGFAHAVLPAQLPVLAPATDSFRTPMFCSSVYLFRTMSPPSLSHSTGGLSLPMLLFSGVRSSSEIYRCSIPEYYAYECTVFPCEVPGHKAHS